MSETTKLVLFFIMLALALGGLLGFLISFLKFLNSDRRRRDKFLQYAAKHRRPIKRKVD